MRLDISTNWRVRLSGGYRYFDQLPNNQNIGQPIHKTSRGHSRSIKDTSSYNPPHGRRPMQGISADLSISHVHSTSISAQYRFKNLSPICWIGNNFKQESNPRGGDYCLSNQILSWAVTGIWDASRNPKTRTQAMTEVTCIFLFWFHEKSRRDSASAGFRWFSNESRRDSVFPVDNLLIWS